MENFSGTVHLSVCMPEQIRTEAEVEQQDASLDEAHGHVVRNLHGQRGFEEVDHILSRQLRRS